jgi:transposase InsO family protein
MHRDGDHLRVCVPSSQRNLILRVMHDLPLGMHQATAKMYGLMSSRFYFPKMAERVKAYVESCEHCQRNKAYTRNTRGVPHPSEPPLRRFDVVALDIVSGFPTTKNGFDAIVVFTDRLTKRVYIEPCNKSASARDLALIFFRTVFRNQGMPRILLSDNGPQFVSNFWKEFFSLLQTDIRLTSSYHPQSNGQTERFNRTLIEALRSFVNARHDNWDTFLVHFEFAYNSTVNASTGLSPFILQFAQAPRAPWDSVLEGGETDSIGALSGADLAFALGFETLQNLKRARASLQEAAQRQRVRNALVMRPHQYAVGDEVLLSTENIVLRLASRKLSPKFIGPFRIIELLGKNAVRIEPTGRFKALKDIVNVEYLRPYNIRTENVGPPPHHLSVKPVAVEPLGEWYQIAEILAHRGRPGQGQQCLVRWEGFDASHDSWVPRRDITPKALVAYEEFLRMEPPQVYREGGGCSAMSREMFQKRLESFIGENGKYSVIGSSGSNRTSKARGSRGEREETGARCDGAGAPVGPLATSVSASNNEHSVAAGGRRSRKPPGFYRV